jgi:undecaprenyl diphosphate synthase
MSKKKYPQHVAVIMDGNGRWAKKKFLPRMAGHKAGLESVRTMITCCIQHNIKVLTLFAFSTENWSRPETEVSGLMQLFIQALKTEIYKLHENQVQLRVIGDINILNNELQSLINDATTLTQDNQGLVLVIALNYGGRWDIVEMVKKVSTQVQNGEKKLNDITPEYVESQLSTGDLPAPDLFIRTSGEMRISNFLLWQLAYSELFFTPVNWPDFDEKIFIEAIEFYESRERRYGGLVESF